MRPFRRVSVSQYHGSIKYLEGLVKVLPVKRAVLQPLPEVRIAEYSSQVRSDFGFQRSLYEAFYLIGCVRVSCHIRFRPSKVQVIAVDPIKLTVDKKGSDRDWQVQDSANRKKRSVTRNRFLFVIVMASNPGAHI